MYFIIIFFNLISLSVLDASANTGNSPQGLYGTVLTGGQKLYSAPQFNQSNFLCNLNIGDTLGLTGQLGGKNRNTFSALIKSNSCNASRGYIYGPPFTKVRHVGGNKNTSPVLVRGGSDYSNIYGSVDKKNINCKVARDTLVYAVGPAFSNPRLTKVQLPQYTKCKSSSGYISSDDIVESSFDNWVTFDKNTPSYEGSDPDEKTESQGPCLTCYSTKTSPKSKKNFIDLKQTVKGLGADKRIDYMINYAEKNKEPKSTGWCYRYVKKALQASGLASKYLEGASAKNAGGPLKAEGFKNLMDVPKGVNKIKSPYNAPMGAILVYSGGEHGHIEIKTKNGFISDYESKMARTGSSQSAISGRNRTLIGVYVKGAS